MKSKIIAEPENWKCSICNCTTWKEILKNKYMIPNFKHKLLIVCAECFCGFIYPKPTEEEIKNINHEYWKYEIISNVHKKETEIKNISRINYLKKFIDLNSLETILDIGAGYGNFFDCLNKNKRLTKNIEYFAVEPDYNMKKVLKNLGVKRIYKDIKEINTNKSFSLIILSHILEHTRNPVKFLNKIKKLMDGKTYLFVEIPNLDGFFKEDLGLHTHVFNVKCIKILIKKLEFKVINLTTVGEILENLIKSNSKKYLIQKVFKFLFRINQNLYYYYKIVKKIFFYLKNLSENNDFDIGQMSLDQYGKSRSFIRILLMKDFY